MALTVDFDREVYGLLGLPFDAVDMAGAVRHIKGAVARRTRCFLSTPNTNFIVGCRIDSEWRDSVICSDLSIADGMPLVWVARLLRVPIRDRVSGSGLFEELRRRRDTRLTVYFFGGEAGVAQAACRRLNADSGGVICAGFEDPGFGSIEEMSSEDALARINASGADFVVVSLGSRKGQAWIVRNRARLLPPVVSHLGAVINFVTGHVRRAPLWMQRLGLEWLWRIKEEPQLWRRYFRDGLVLLRLVTTRVIPYAWFMAWHTPSREDLESAAIDTSDMDAELVIHLRGAWVRGNLQPLRASFSMAASSGRDLRVDLQSVLYVDAAFLGLMLLLHGAQKSRGKRLSCGPLNPTVRRIFMYGCSEFLLNEDTGAVSTETATQSL
jgi:N-acetylglucosaminyldiphosphoundecaprenol N-acetyl-beta-D-mannosaminyltransferase